MTHTEKYFSQITLEILFLLKQDTIKSSFNVDFTFAPSKLKVTFPMTLKLEHLVVGVVRIYT